MAEFRTIRMAFWTDPYIEDLEPKAKLLYIYLFTNPYANNLGIIESTRRKIAYETGLTQADVDKLLTKFEADGKVVCDTQANLIFVTRFVRHQCSTSPRLMDGLQKLAVSIPSEKIARALCILYPQVYGVSRNDGDTVSIPYADGIHTLNIPSGELGIRNLELGKGKEEEEAGKPAPPCCPQQKILDLYHAELPTLPKMKVWVGDARREGNLRARWRERWEKQKYNTADEGLAYWQRLFRHIRECPWLMGEVTPNNGRPPFRADLAWLVLPENFAKVIEGKYDRRPEQ